MRNKAKRTKAEIAADKLRTGRPPKPPAQVLSERVMIRMTTAERSRLEALAKREGVPLATMVMRPWREEQ